MNNFVKNQGEIVMGVNTEGFNKEFKAPDKPYMIADVRFANGADNNFVKELFKNIDSFGDIVKTGTDIYFENRYIFEYFMSRFL